MYPQCLFISTALDQPYYSDTIILELDTEASIKEWRERKRAKLFQMGSNL